MRIAFIICFFIITQVSFASVFYAGEVNFKKTSCSNSQSSEKIPFIEFTSFSSTGKYYVSQLVSQDCIEISNQIEVLNLQNKRKYLGNFKSEDFFRILSQNNSLEIILDDSQLPANLILLKITSI